LHTLRIIGIGLKIGLIPENLSSLVHVAFDKIIIDVACKSSATKKKVSKKKLRP
jgi:hypothetical protein